MTFFDWLIIAAIATALVLVHKRVNRDPAPDPPTPDHGGVPAERISYIGEWPDEPIVPKRRKPRVGGLGLRTKAIEYRGETFIFTFPQTMLTLDVLDAAKRWKDRDDLAFDDMCEAAIADLLFMDSEGI